MADEPRGMAFEIAASNEVGRRAWGWIGLVASARGLRWLGLPVASKDEAWRLAQSQYADLAWIDGDPFLLDVAEQLRDYFDCRRHEFTVELDLRGHTTFELSVWAVTARVPYGETRTYAWVASQLNSSTNSAQAVGSALGSNPVPLLVPCHRIIGSDGSLHGFAGGLDMKARLLAMENRQLALPLF